MDVKITPFESLQIDGFAAGTENDVKREVSRLVVFRLRNEDQFETSSAPPCRRRNQKYSSVELNDELPGALHAIPCHPRAHSKRGISPLCTPANVHILIWAWSNVYNWNVTSLCIPANMDLVNLALCTNIPLTCTYEIYPPSRHIDLNLS